MEKMRMRCRWARAENLAIYTKEHLWLRNQGRLFPEILELGSFLAESGGDLMADLWIQLFDEARAGHSKEFYPKQGPCSYAGRAVEVQAPSGV